MYLSVNEQTCYCCCTCIRRCNRNSEILVRYRTSHAQRRPKPKPPTRVGTNILFKVSIDISKHPTSDKFKHFAVDIDRLHYSSRCRIERALPLVPRHPAYFLGTSTFKFSKNCFGRTAGSTIEIVPHHTERIFRVSASSLLRTRVECSTRNTVLL